MARVNVHEAHDNGYGGTEYTLAGWFDSQRAQRYSDVDRNGNGSGGTGRGQAVYRTAQGRWVLEHWTSWQGEHDRAEYIDAEAAKTWLLENDFDDAVKEHFGEIEDERGPGRPEVGPATQVRLGEDLTARVDAARHAGESRAAAIRRLLEGALG
jgi:hypothetical protein